MIWRIYSLLSMSLSPWQWEYWWDAGFWIISASFKDWSFPNALVEAEVSPGGGPPLQQSSEAKTTGRRTPRISIHIPAAPLQQSPSSFPSPGLKKTGKYPSLIMLSVSRDPSLSKNTGLAVGLPSRENQERLFGLRLGEKQRKAEQTYEWKFGTCLTQ